MSLREFNPLTSLFLSPEEFRDAFCVAGGASTNTDNITTTDVSFRGKCQVREEMSEDELLRGICPEGTCRGGESVPHSWIDSSVWLKRFDGFEREETAAVNAKAAACERQMQSFFHVWDITGGHWKGDRKQLLSHWLKPLAGPLLNSRRRIFILKFSVCITAGHRKSNF